MTAESEDPTLEADATDSFTLLRELGNLRYAGILTEDEFAAKKAEILARI